jgi:uncharacterized protein involved in outer membrane biogenesis
MALSPSPRSPRRWLRIVALAIGAVIVLGIAGVVAFVVTFDPNSYKPQIIAAVESATGRQLQLNGHIGLSLSLQPTIEISDVSFSNPAGYSRPQMATLQKLEVQLALIPLLSKQVQIDKLVLVKPDILLERNAQGHGNWEFAPAAAGALAGAPPTASTVPASGDSTPAPTATPGIALSSLRIEDGTLAIRDATGKTTTLGLKQFTAKASSPDSPMHLTIDATYNGAPLSVTADSGPLTRLMDSIGTAPWPVKLALTAAGAKLGVDGSIAQPTQGRGIALSISADVPDMTALGTLAGATLPPLKNLTAQFKLTDSGNDQTFTATDLKLALPQFDLAGTASYVLGAHPMVTANLTSKRIDLDALNAILSGSGQAPTVGKSASGGASVEASAAKSRYVIPDTKLPFDQLRPLNGDVTVAVDALRSGGADYTNLKMRAVAAQGQLTIDPFGVDAPGGHIDVKVTANANATPPAVTLSLRAPAVALQPLLKALGKPGYASGNVEVRADLRGAGDSPHAIAASLDGSIGVALAKGEIDSQLLGGLMSGLLQKADLTQLASKSGMSTLNCFALRLDATRGVGTLKALRLDTSTLTMDGTGGMNFGNETLDMRLRPAAGVAGTNITVPLKVGGTFAVPSIEPDAVGAITGNVGTAAKLALGASTGGLGLIIGSAIEQKISGDPCAEPLALARFSQAPAASQPSGNAPTTQQKAQPQSSGVGDTLRKLFQ